MSGICAIIARLEQPVEPFRLNLMLRAMAYRGPDGPHVAATEHAAIGHCLLATDADGPEMGRLVQEGNIVAAADCRLDNRGELAEMLGVPQSAGDTEILIAGYRRWGEALAQHLLGDFAFIIWDAERRRFYAARDHFGIKPFYYALTPRFLVCGSDIPGLFASGLVQREVREAAIADFLAGLPPAQDETSFADIRRLPPGHFCVSSGDDFRVAEYWSLALPEIIYRRAAPEEFRQLLGQAVAARQRGGPGGAMLSGGLDSSSIASLAASVADAAPLPVFSMVFDATPELNERPFIEAVLRKGGFAPHFIASDDVPPFGALDTILAEQEDLFLAPNMACSRRMYYAAREAGVRVLLDGHGGDEVAPVGAGRMFELAAAGRWLTVWRQLGESLLPAGESKLAAFWGLLGAYSPLRRLRRVPAARRLFPRAPPDPSLSFINPAFAERNGPAQRQRKPGGRKPKSALFEAQRHYDVLTGALQSYAFEILDRTAAAAQVEPRYPFWDKRLVEFCLSLPPEEKLDEGWGRMILRRGMEGLLPREVQWRSTKFNFLQHLADAMLRNHATLISEVLADRETILAPYIDLAKLGAAYDRWRENPDQPSGYVVQCISRAVILAAWLKRQRAAKAGVDPAARLYAEGV